MVATDAQTSAEIRKPSHYIPSRCEAMDTAASGVNCLTWYTLPAKHERASLWAHEEQTQCARSASCEVAHAGSCARNIWCEAVPAKCAARHRPREHSARLRPRGLDSDNLHSLISRSRHLASGRSSSCWQTKRACTCISHFPSFRSSPIPHKQYSYSDRSPNQGGASNDRRGMNRCTK